ncbi:uncharacterized protein Dmoj_GI14196 [Drosophila mojavensis]|uniref:Uncharacterized protein n=1 Tax=Drosophila mojavensis TaxID=7230 RepID=B4L9S8_DROMO|nr:uncharacterized protein Dmoj_GI14196 [Drosophila mojavensis]
MDDRSPSRGWEGGREHCPSVDDPAPKTAARDGVEERRSDVSRSSGEEFQAEDASPEEGGIASPIPRGLDDGSPSRRRDGGRECYPSVDDPAPKTAARDGAEVEQLSMSRSSDEEFQVEDANPEEDATADPVRISLRYTPGTVENRRLSRSSQSSAERPTGHYQASRRKRRRRRQKGRPVSARKPDPCTPAGQGKPTDGAEVPSAHRHSRKWSRSGSGQERDGSRDESTETRSSEERRLLADMAELLDGWEVSLEDALGAEDVEATRMLPLIPVNWRVRPAGTELRAEMIQLLRREVETRGRRHRRTRFRVAAGGRSFTWG